MIDADTLRNRARTLLNMARVTRKQGERHPEGSALREAFERQAVRQETEARRLLLRLRSK